MQEIPGIREELRASIEKDDVDDYTRKFQYTTLLLDETYRQSQLAEQKREFGFEKQKYADAKKAAAQAAKQEYGLDLYGEQTDRINAGTRAAQVELNAAREARQAAKDKASIRQADARIKVAQEKLALEKRKASGKGSGAQKAETDLALDILTDRDAILGKVNSDFPEEGRVGGMTYSQAYAYVKGLADAQMGSYRGKAYIDKWVKARLKALGLGQPQKRSGR
jgi:hypothetical protein